MKKIFTRCYYCEKDIPTRDDTFAFRRCHIRDGDQDVLKHIIFNLCKDCYSSSILKELEDKRDKKHAQTRVEVDKWTAVTRLETL